MAMYTNYFTLSSSLQNSGFQAPTPTLTEGKVYTTEDLLDTLYKILEPIKTLDDYETLISVIDDMKYQITFRFIYMFYQALIPVEERVWASAGMHPPVKQYIKENLGLLLDDYNEYASKLESALISWADENGFRDDPEKEAFIIRRNEIMADYTVIVGVIIGSVVE